MIAKGEKQNKKGVLNILKKLKRVKVSSTLLKDSLIGKMLTKISKLDQGHFSEDEGLKEEE
jgi:hypothetical protein